MGASVYIGANVWVQVYACKRIGCKCMGAIVWVQVCGRKCIVRGVIKLIVNIMKQEFSIV